MLLPAIGETILLDCVLAIRGTHGTFYRSRFLLLLGILIAVPIQVTEGAESDRQLILSVSAQIVAKRPLTTG